MALLFLESFDHYSVPSQKWTNNNPAGGDANFSIAANGRFGNGGNKASGTRRGLSLSSFGAKATWIIGCAFQHGGTDGGTSIFFLRDSGTIQVDLRILSSAFSYKLQLALGNATNIAVGTRTLMPNVWYYVELKVTIGNSAAYEVMLNGISEMSGTGDTQATANASANEIGIGEYTTFNGAGTIFDDLYICDNTGGVNDDFLGDIRVQALFPNGNGNSSVLVGSDGNSTDNYLLVDETTPNDADYVESSTPGDKDTYTYTNLTPTTGTVHGLQIIPRAAKTDAGVRSIQAIARHSGTEEDTGTDFTLSTSALYYMDTRDTKPGGGAWSITDVNAAEFGVKVTA